MYNRHPRKIIDFELSTADDLTPAKSIKISDEMLEKNMEKLLYIRKKYHEKAHTNIQAAQERQKFYYNTKHDTHHVRKLVM